MEQLIIMLSIRLLFVFPAAIIAQKMRNGNRSCQISWAIRLCNSFHIHFSRYDSFSSSQERNFVFFALFSLFFLKNIFSNAISNCLNVAMPWFLVVLLYMVPSNKFRRPFFKTPDFAVTKYCWSVFEFLFFS